MQFGAHLPTYWEHYGTSDVRSAVAAAAQAAEALGYHSVWANDLVVAPASKVAGANAIEPLITLASLIHLAPRLRLGTSVLVLPQRDAFLVAKQAAALDVLSGGRLILGVGVGHRAEEFRLLGADFARRGAVTDEAIEVLWALWREPVARYDGRFHRFDGVRMFPKPPHGGPPIWIGGGRSPGVLRRVARHGGAWLPYMITLEDFRSGVAALREMTRGGPCPVIAKEFHLRLTRPGEPADVPTTYPQARPGAAGSADAVAQHLEPFRKAGMEFALCAFASEGVDDLLRQLRLFAEEVAPRFADAG